MRAEPITYEDVREACGRLLAGGEGPSRPKVQDLLAVRIGRRGSNSIVQAFINKFWEEAAERMKKPIRPVADIPDDCVAILDEALVKMLDVARRITATQFIDREEDLARRISQWQAAVQEAQDTAVASDQLRLRAEGELNAQTGLVAELRERLAGMEEKWSAECRRADALAQTVAAKDAELQRQFSALEERHQRIEQISEFHRQEAQRLMQQIDAERQEARKELGKLEKKLDAVRSAAQTASEENLAARSENNALRRELESSLRARDQQDQRLKRADEELMAARTVANELAAMRARFEISEQHRRESVKLSDALSAELTELRIAYAQTLASLEKKEDNSPPVLPSSDQPI